MVKLGWLGGALLCAGLFGCATPQPRADGGLGALDIVTAPAAALDTVWQARPDGVIGVAGKPSGFIVTRDVYTDYRLHVEWRWTGKPGNGGVLLHVASGPKDGVWPYSIQVQTKHGSVGDLLPMAGATFHEPLTTAPGAYPPIKARTAPDSELAPGEWNTMDVLVRGGCIDVTINGVAQNAVTLAQPATGRIGFQLEGTPYELRNLRVERL
ncbi:DUF1080 domain-containing protein [Massilia pinisoli]|uniref:DUF1080 domain-containing protein n=1 Tax=Massilia pinisoli TaxID=1772194 RepID=A0ABT1ZTB8_9BURK|nr:DUF1080 domain-containing protein [Massilia pinisoli]MCS0583163.1 DUF1080 domain-containing protein [Massilia pinisoli]